VRSSATNRFFDNPDQNQVTSNLAFDKRFDKRKKIIVEA